MLPHPFPTREELAQKPNKTENTQNFREIINSMEKKYPSIDRQSHRTRRWRKKETFDEVIANNMKKSYNVYNKEHTHYKMR